MNFHRFNRRAGQETLFILIVCFLWKEICCASVSRILRNVDVERTDKNIDIDATKHFENLENLEELTNQVEHDNYRLFDFSNIQQPEITDILSRFDPQNGENIANAKARDLLSSLKDGTKLDIVLPSAIPTHGFPPIFKEADDHPLEPPDYNPGNIDYSYFLDNDSVDEDYTYYGYNSQDVNNGDGSNAKTKTPFNKLPQLAIRSRSKDVPVLNQSKLDSKTTLTKPHNIDDNDLHSHGDKSSIAVKDLDTDDDQRNEVLPSQSTTSGEGSVRRPRQPPKFMLDLYNKFSKKGFAQPTADVVRSFMNINEAETGKPKSKADDHKNSTRVHTLLFNVTSISADEDIRLAELRLYTLVERDRKHYFGVDRKVSIYEVVSGDNKTSRSFLLCSRHIYGRHSGWETFKITPAVRRWVWTKTFLKNIEIKIESVFNYSGGVSNLDIDTSTQNNNDPLLIVFSNENRRKRTEHHEVMEMIAHEISTKTEKEINESTPHKELQKIHSDLVEADNAHSISKRATESEDFVYDDVEEDGDSNDDLYMSDSPAVSDGQKKKRHLRKKMKGRGGCRRSPMYVDFADLQWDNWIIAPHGYSAFECTGKCYFPLSSKLTPSKHAIVQTLLHTNYPKKASRACCVPTKLDPISILYVDKKGVVTYKYRYEGMVVAECGCR